MWTREIQWVNTEHEEEDDIFEHRVSMSDSSR